MAHGKPDGRAADTEHGDREHEHGGIVVDGHLVDAVDDQVSTGTQDKYQEKDLCPFLGSVLLALVEETFFLHEYLYSEI